MDHCYRPSLVTVCLCALLSVCMCACVRVRTRVSLCVSWYACRCPCASLCLCVFSTSVLRTHINTGLDVVLMTHIFRQDSVFVESMNHPFENSSAFNVYLKVVCLHTRLCTCHYSWINDAGPRSYCLCTCHHLCRLQDCCHVPYTKPDMSPFRYSVQGEFNPLSQAPFS